MRPVFNSRFGPEALVLVGWKAELMPYESQQKGRMEADGRNLDTDIRPLNGSYMCIYILELAMII